MSESTPSSTISCPAPLPTGDRLLLAHGEGARLMRRLIQEEIVSVLDNPILCQLTDGAILPGISEGIVLSTDSYVVQPLFFPGGDIGSLAVHGTVNDLAVMGAEPLYLCLGMIVEEGLPIETLRQVLKSVSRAARACGTSIVTGDTKVVPRGAADRLFLHTSGIGRLLPGVSPGPQNVRPGDVVLVNGTLGDHGMTILAAREQLDDGGALQSDTAPLNEIIRALLSSEAEVRFLRDATRGGVSAVLHELAETAHVSVLLHERDIPVSAPVRGMCELLGMEPLHVANEGKFVAVVSESTVGEALKCLKQHPLGAEASVIGVIRAENPGEVHVQGVLGRLRLLIEPAGALLPRIC